MLRLKNEYAVDKDSLRNALIKFAAETPAANLEKRAAALRRAAQEKLESMESRLDSMRDALDGVPAAFKKAAEDAIEKLAAEIDAAKMEERDYLEIAASEYETAISKQINKLVNDIVEEYGKVTARGRWKVVNDRLFSPEGEEVVGFTTTSTPDKGEKACVATWALPESHPLRKKGSGWVVGYISEGVFTPEGMVNGVTSASALVAGAGEIWGVHSYGVNNTPFQSSRPKGRLLSREDIAGLDI